MGAKLASKRAILEVGNQVEVGIVYVIMKRIIALLVLLLLVAASCGSSTSAGVGSQDQTEPTTVDLPGGPDDPDAPEGDDDGAQGDPGDASDVPELADDEVVFVWAENGGCAQAGPNCARYEVLADGTVNTYRQGEDEVAATGSIDQDLVNDWLLTVGTTDVDALRGRLGPGEMTAAFDGVDFLLEAPYAALSLDSIDVEFAAGEPLFEAANSMAKAAVEAAPLEMKMR